MEINKKNRTEIKKYFRANAIPTQRQFEDFVDAGINQAEDGIARPSGHPLSIQAEGDEKSTQDLIHFYKKFDDENPSWSVSQNPRTVASNPDTNKPGLSFNDGSGASRLYIASTGGNVGLGTIEPSDKLHIYDGDITLEDPNESSQAINWKNKRGRWHLSGPRTYDGANQLSFYWHDNTKWNGPYLSIKDDGRVGIGTANPRAALDVKGAIMPSSGNGAWAGILFPPNPGGGSGDEAWIRYYARAGEGCNLELGIGNDGDDHISLMPTGNVGVGTNSPAYKLHVYDGGLMLQDPGTSSEAVNWVNNNGKWHLSGPRSYESANQLSIYWHDNTKWNGPFFSVMDTGNVGIGTNEPKARLEVRGAIMPAAGNTEDSGILFPRDAHGGGGDRAWMRWYSRSGESTTLELGVANDGTDHIALMASGNVGVGTNAPTADLDVVGTAKMNTLYVYKSGGTSSGMASFDSQNTEAPYINWYHKGKRHGYIQAGIRSGKNVMRFMADYADRFHFVGGKVGIEQFEPKQALDVNGNVNIDGALFINNRAVAFEDFEIYVRGSAYESPQGNYTLMKVAGQSISMNQGRGLNTTILKADGTYKTRATHDVYGSAGNWNVWANWVKANAATDEVVCVASFDAVIDCPRGGSAETFLLEHGASTAFAATNGSGRTPFAMLFVRGQLGAIEVRTNYKGPNAFIRASYYDLFQREGQVIRGMITMWTGTRVPAGWALCDGANGTPDLRGRFVLGSGTGPGRTARTLNHTGGTETHVLSLHEIPPHAHQIWTKQDDWNVSGGPRSNQPGYGVDNGGWVHTNNTKNSGGGGAHNNMPPFYVLAYIMKL